MPRRTAILLVGRIVSAGTTLVILGLVGRLRGAEDLGAVGIGFAMGAILTAVTDLGAASLLVREAARQPKRAGQLLVGLVLFRILILAAAIVAIGPIATAIAPGVAATIVVVATGLAVQSFAELTRGVFMARQRFTIISAHFVIENLAWFAAVAVPLVVAPSQSTQSIFFGGLLVLCASAAVGFALAFTVGGERLGLPTRGEVRQLAGQAPPFALFAVLGNAYARIDTIIVGALLPGGLAAAGSYYAATRVIAALEYVPDAAARGAFPELVRRRATEPTTVAPLLGRVSRGLLLIGASIPAVLLAAGDRLLPGLFGTPPDSGWVLPLLSVAVPLRYLGYLYGVALTSADAQGKRVAAAASALVLVVTINVLGIGLIGLAAPVLSAVVASAAVCLIYAIFVRREFGSLGIKMDVWLTLLAASAVAAAAGIGVRLAAPASAGLLFGAATALSVYAVIVAAGPARPMLVAILSARAPNQ
jgi:O-antigen/teichoic acid export membrane protein